MIDRFNTNIKKIDCEKGNDCGTITAFIPMAFLVFAVYLSPLLLITRGYFYHRRSWRWSSISLLSAATMSYLLIRLLGKSNSELGIMLYFPAWVAGWFLSLVFWFTASMMSER